MAATTPAPSMIVVDGQIPTSQLVDAKLDASIDVRPADSPQPGSKAIDDEETVFIIPTTPPFPASAEDLAAIEALDLDSRPLPPRLEPTISPSVEQFNTSPESWLQDYSRVYGRTPVNSLAVGAIVFDSLGRVLLVQRAHHDTSPDLWEAPAGKVEPDKDTTVISALARELWEETGLVAAHVRWFVPPPPRDHGTERCSSGPNSSGSICADRHGRKRWCFVAFDVEVEDTSRVVLHPREHQDYAWAEMDEVQAETRRDGTPLPITNELMKKYILSSFMLRE